MASPRAALITGGAKRIGAVLATSLAAEGYDIALHYHTSQKEAEAVQKDIEALGVACALFPHDLMDTAGLDALVLRVKETFSHLNTLINNASVFERATLLESDVALFDRQHTINLKAPIFLTQAFAKHIGTGCVINMIDSNIAHFGTSHFMYLLSKKSLAEFTRMSARALGANIRVNAICPGAVIPSNENDQEYETRLQAKLPLARLPNVEDICAAVSWLLTQPNITGQLIYTDSGQHLL